MVMVMSGDDGRVRFRVDNEMALWLGREMARMRRGEAAATSGQEQDADRGKRSRQNPFGYVAILTVHGPIDDGLEN